MSASKKVKDSGLKNMIEMSELSNIPTSTLYDHYNNNYQMFEIVLLGCLTKKQMNNVEPGHSANILIGKDGPVATY
jgi:hypothetical protein